MYAKIFIPFLISFRALENCWGLFRTLPPQYRIGFRCSTSRLVSHFGISRNRNCTAAYRSLSISPRLSPQWDRRFRVARPCGNARQTRKDFPGNPKTSIFGLPSANQRADCSFNAAQFVGATPLMDWRNHPGLLPNLPPCRQYRYPSPCSRFFILLEVFHENLDVHPIVVSSFRILFSFLREEP